MIGKEQQIKEILIEENETFKLLNLKHQEFDQRLIELNNRNLFTDQDWIEVQELKKEKLRLKDSMQKYIFEYRHQHNV